MTLAPLPLQRRAVVSTKQAPVDTTRRKKHQIRLELDLNKQFDYDLTGHIYWLKRQRKFTPTLRDALRLIWDLQQGKTDVLMELFGWVAEAFVMQHRLDEERLAELIAARLHTRPAVVFTEADLDTVELEVKAGQYSEDADDNILAALRSFAQSDDDLPTPEINLDNIEF